MSDDARRLVLGDPPGPVLHLLTLGATVDRLEVTDGHGRRRDVVLGLPTVAERLAARDYLGATIGRYANRIAGGRLDVDGHEVVLATNDRGNTLHGGPDGWDRRVWDVVDHADHAVTLQLVSPDGDQGFPGRVTALVHVRVDATTVRLDHEATTDAPTVVSMTNHAYWNLDGSATVEDHVLRVPADRWTPVDATGIPTGERPPVDGTPFDLRHPTRLGDAIGADDEQVRAAGGLDHDLVVDGSGLRQVASLSSRRSRLTLTVRSDQPGLQVYTGNGLDGSTRSRGGAPLRRHAGVALEPQLHPDSPHHAHEPGWPTPVLRPGEVYRSTVEWSFSPAAP